MSEPTGHVQQIEPSILRNYRSPFRPSSPSPSEGALLASRGGITARRSAAGAAARRRPRQPLRPGRRRPPPPSAATGGGATARRPPPAAPPPPSSPRMKGRALDTAAARRPPPPSLYHLEQVDSRNLRGAIPFLLERAVRGPTAVSGRRARSAIEPSILRNCRSPFRPSSPSPSEGALASRPVRITARRSRPPAPPPAAARRPPPAARRPAAALVAAHEGVTPDTAAARRLRHHPRSILSSRLTAQFAAQFPSSSNVPSEDRLRCGADGARSANRAVDSAQLPFPVPTFLPIPFRRCSRLASRGGITARRSRPPAPPPAAAMIVLFGRRSTRRGSCSSARSTRRGSCSSARSTRRGSIRSTR